MRKYWLIAAALALMLGASGPPAIAADESPPKEKQAPAGKAEADKEQAQPFKLAGPLTFKLEESPAFGKVEIGGRPVQRSFQWQYARCSGEPNKAVKAYPQLASKQPLYGELRVDGHLYDPSQGPGRVLCARPVGRGAEARRANDEKKPTSGSPCGSRTRRPSTTGSTSTATATAT